MTLEGDIGLPKLGRYELITRIGQGGMAEVRLALQRGPGGFEKLVVIKLVHQDLASQKTFVDMLMDEARVAALVKHPNVIDIYDLGEADGRYYIAMEYLEGEPLLSLLRAGRDGARLDPLSTARLIADTAEGLDAAHELRSMAGEPMELVHHDVSLGNIVVLYNGQVKLVDFGVAKATAKASGAVKVHGKFGYMAPEKLQGVPGDRRSDIWSLAVVLWEALTLRRLFKGGNDRDTARQVLELDIPRPSSINGDVLPDLDPIVMRALERDPARRYPRAKELAQDLEEVLRVHGYGGRNDQIARYMQSTFAAHIAGRKRLLQEVSTKGRPSAAVLRAAFDAVEVTTPSRPRTPRVTGELTVRFKSPTRGHAVPHGMTAAPATAAGPRAVEEIIERRRSEEMMAEGTPHSGVRPMPKRITQPPQFAEATPMNPRAVAPLPAEPAGHPPLGPRAVAPLPAEPAGHPPLGPRAVAPLPAEPAGHPPLGPRAIADRAEMTPPEIEIEADDAGLDDAATILQVPDPGRSAAMMPAVTPDATLELGDLLDRSIDELAPAPAPAGEASPDPEGARSETLGRSIADILERLPAPGAPAAQPGANEPVRREPPPTSPVLTPRRTAARTSVSPVAIRVESARRWPVVLAIALLLAAIAAAALVVLTR